MPDKSWNLVANIYNDQVGETGDFYHATYLNPVILKLLGKIKGKKILDLACGQGYFSRILAKRGAKVTGIDIADKLLKIAEDKEQNKAMGIKYYLQDSAKLKKLPLNYFDFIVSNVSFHDIKNIEGTIKECSRVLKNNGKIFFSIPHPIRDIATREKNEDGFFLKLKNYSCETARQHGMKSIKDAKSNILIYHRPIGFYIQELLKNKLYISDFLEINKKHQHGKPVTDKKMLQFEKEIPSFLIIGAKKIK